MIIQPKKYESYLQISEKIGKMNFSPIEYDKSSVKLRVIDIVNFGNALRLAVGSNGNYFVTNYEDTRVMVFKNPYRIVENVPIKIIFHLTLKELPKDVVAQILPSPESCMLFDSPLMKKGELYVGAFPMRRTQVDPYYPLGRLVFVKVEESNDVDPGTKAETVESVVEKKTKKKASGE